MPATPTAIATERLCHLVHSRKKPLSEAAKQVREWIIAETRNDVANVSKQYPELNLESFMAKGF